MAGGSADPRTRDLRRYRWRSPRVKPWQRAAWTEAEGDDMGHRSPARRGRFLLTAAAAGALAAGGVCLVELRMTCEL